MEIGETRKYIYPDAELDRTESAEIEKLRTKDET